MDFTGYRKMESTKPISIAMFDHRGRRARVARLRWQECQRGSIENPGVFPMLGWAAAAHRDRQECLRHEH
jgi:hypothetical protein